MFAQRTFKTQRDPYWNKVVTLIGNDNQPNATSTFVDQAHHKILTTTGTPQYAVANTPPNMRSSIRVTSSSIQMAPQDLWFGSQDMCAEMYLYLRTSNPGVVMTTQPTNVNDAFVFAISPNFQQAYSSNGGSWDVLTNWGTITAGTWFHYATYKIGDNFYGAIDGTVQFLNNVPGFSLFQTTNNLCLGAQGDGSNPIDAQFCSFRLTVGYSRYGASNFTRPTLPFPAQ